MGKTLLAVATAAGALLATAPPVPAAPAAPVPAPYLAQGIEWKPCFETPPPELPPGSERLECGSFQAPRDWDRPDDGESVTIAVSRLAPADGQAERGSLLTNPGGPGGPGRTLPLTFLGRQKLLDSFEVVGIDPRGTGDSTNISCGGATTIGADLDPRDRSQANVDKLLDSAEQIAAGCQRENGDLGPLITTEQTVRDLDLLRELLGREKVSWVGYSGGTWMGAYYATYFPHRVDKFVLDSNTDFTASWQDSFGWQPMGFERRMVEDFQPWAAAHDGLYRLGSTSDQVRATFEDLRAQVKRKPVDMPGVGVIDEIALDAAAGQAMYSKTQFEKLAAGLAYLKQPIENPQGATAQTAGFAGLFQRADDAFDSTFFAITCNDTPWHGDREWLAEWSGELNDRYPLIGGGKIVEPCVFWNRPDVSMPTPTGNGVPPVLMVQSVHDAATPFEGARQAHERFAGSRMLTVTGEGDHGVYAGGNACVDDVVESYLVDGVVPGADLTCEGLPIPEPPAAASTGAENPLLANERYGEAAGRLPV
ncbi:alpha/beta hydrolase [Saccharopolyspora taberi]|uniref:Alpha/beta hydrolase n=1 Tax=Saccharopolyspora taberi TaxID=60895 RepID=A0ABN3V3J8_9PSEU